MSAAGAGLYSEVLKVTEEYLGPAADRFVKRQITFHLNKKPEDITPGDVAKLTEWMKVSLAMLTEDKTMVDKCTNDLLALAQ